MAAQYRVHLTSAERQHLSALTRRGSASARTIRRARTLLLADTGQPDAAIATAVGVSARTVQRTRQRAVQAGVLAALAERPRPGKPRALSAAQEVALVTLACSDPPTGQPVWTLRLLTERLIELAVVETISDETVRRTLKKTNSSPGACSSGAFRGPMPST